MPIGLTPFTSGSVCTGYTWQINDESELARLVGRLMLGQYLHVVKVLAETGCTPPTSSEAMVASVLRRLYVPDGADPWHRDGLLFQHISWIAAARMASTDAVLCPPHLIPAHKGFDGIQLEVERGAESLSAIIIFEDKATTNPRETVREDVWPGIEAIERGERDVELMQTATLLLQTRSDVNVDAAIANIVWGSVRRYRVSITVGDTHSDPKGRERLFAGFDDAAAGADIGRRRGETYQLNDLRKWMAEFAQTIAASLTEVPANV